MLLGCCVAGYVVGCWSTGGPDGDTSTGPASLYKTISYIRHSDWNVSMKSKSANPLF